MSFTGDLSPSRVPAGRRIEDGKDTSAIKALMGSPGADGVARGRWGQYGGKEPD